MGGGEQHFKVLMLSSWGIAKQDYTFLLTLLLKPIYEGEHGVFKAVQFGSFINVVNCGIVVWPSVWGKWGTAFSQTDSYPDTDKQD